MGEVPVVAPLILQVSKVTPAAPPQLSLNVGLGVAMDAAHWFRSVFLVIFAGHVIAGASLSVTVTVKEQVVVCPFRVDV